MAEIFLARTFGEGGFYRDAVIKRLFPHLAEHESTREMFQYEARLLAELNHPSIPQVYELGVVDGQWFMAMEYVEGSTLAEVFQQGAKHGLVMGLEPALSVVLQACEALHHAHERRDRAHRPLHIVHRDVTPHNLMVTRDGVAKVMDFGVAQTAARQDEEDGAVKGTYAYMAPEQIRAMPLDRRADVFALGVILYELTTGTRLFRGSEVQVMTAIVEQDIPLPSSRAPGYPRGLEEIVLWALQREPAHRMGSAAELAVRLQRFALDGGMALGPRVIADYYQAVYPYEREQEAELALVQSDPHQRALADLLWEDNTDQLSPSAFDRDLDGDTGPMPSDILETLDSVELVQEDRALGVAPPSDVVGLDEVDVFDDSSGRRDT